MNWRRRIGLPLLGGALGAALLWGSQPPPVEIETAVVGRAPLAVVLEEEGRTRVMDRFLVSAPVAGLAPRIDLEVGDEVAPGHTLLTLLPSPAPLLDPRSRGVAEANAAAAASALLAAEAEQAAAQAQADYAQAEHRRLNRLRETGGVSPDQVERAAAEARRSEAALRAVGEAVEVARHQAEAARLALRDSAPALPAGERIPILAPSGGRVLKRLRESEGPVTAGQPLLELGDPRRLEVVTEVLSEEAVRLSPGSRVWFERWGGPEPLEGVVRRVEPAGFTKVSALGVEEQRTLVIADFIDPPERRPGLGDGFRVETRFILWEADGVLQVPGGALFRHGEGWAVFVVEAGRAHLRPLTPGQRSGLRAQVLSGLEEGEQVIVHPDAKIADGIRVTHRRPR
jgi:HlyD family secretion protein